MECWMINWIAGLAHPRPLATAATEYRSADAQAIKRPETAIMSVQQSINPSIQQSIYSLSC